MGIFHALIVFPRAPVSQSASCSMLKRSFRGSPKDMSGPYAEI